MAEKMAVAVQLDRTIAQSIITSLGMSGDPESVLRFALTSLATDLAHGGMMLSPASMRTLNGSVGDIDEAGIVAAVEKASQKREGRTVVTFDVDPGQIAGISDLARKADTTVPRLLQERLQYCLDQGWVMDVKSDLPHCKFRPEDYNDIALSMGLDPATDVVHGADIADWVRSAAAMLKTETPVPERA
jgi:hypothetical protein